MKKLVAVLMTVAMVAAMAGCKNSKETTKASVTPTSIEVPASSEENNLMQLRSMKRTEGPNMLGQVGGWDGNIDNIDIEKNAEAKAALEKATASLTGMSFEGIYLLGKQIVSGTNYCFLCKGTATVPDAIPGYYLVYVYADLNSNASVLKIDPLLEVPEAGLSGGWAVNTGDVAFDKNADVKAAYEKALASMVMAGGEMEPVAYLGSKVVAGLNYLLLCRVKAVVEDPSTELVLVTVYADLEGNATITTQDVNWNPEFPDGEPIASEESVAESSADN